MEDFITVTVVTAKLKKEVKDKFIELSSKLGVSEPNKDDFGRSAQYYIDLGIDPPEELKQRNSPQSLDITKEDYDIIEKTGKVKISIITFFVDNEDFGSTIYTDTDFTITVKETSEEIENKINILKNGVK